MELNKIIHGDALEQLKKLPDESVDCIITSPPYWALRDYGIKEQLGLEPTYKEYIEKLCNIFNEAQRVLKKTGTCWVNIGDTYMGNSSYSEKGRQGFGNDKIGMINKKQYLDPKYPTDTKLRAREHVYTGQIIEKSLCQIPSRFGIEMTDRKWILRNEIIWHKPNCMPSSVEDRFTVDFEKVFFFTKNKRYYFKQQLEQSIWGQKDSRAGMGGIHYAGKREGKKGTGNENFVSLTTEKNKRTVWTINTKPFKDAHFATFPEDLIAPMLKAGCPTGGVVLDMFMGAGTTAMVAKRLGVNFIGIEINKEYIKIAEERIKSISNTLF